MIPIPLCGSARERYAVHYGTAAGCATWPAGSGDPATATYGASFSLVLGALSGDPDFETTRRALALPALGSFLWDPELRPPS